MPDSTGGYSTGGYIAPGMPGSLVPPMRGEKVYDQKTVREFGKIALDRLKENMAEKEVSDKFVRGTEVRSVSSTGGEKGVKIERHSLIPAGALGQLAAHYGVGASKYSDWQWRKGYEWSKSYDALQRHASAFWAGEDFDEETGSNHMAAVAWHAFTLLTFFDEFPEFDDRFKK